MLSMNVKQQYLSTNKSKGQMKCTICLILRSQDANMLVNIV